MAGYFYVGAYAPDTLQIIARPIDAQAKMANCAGVEFLYTNADLGYVAFSPGAVAPGCNPCDGPCPGPLIPPPPPECQSPPPPPPPPPGGASILVHVGTPTTKNQCEAGRLSTCASANVSGGLSESGVGPYHFIYLLASIGGLSNLSGLQCGISYDGNLPNGLDNLSKIDVFGWTLCANLEFKSPAWPAPGTGNLITWDPDSNCQFGNIAVAGYFYAAAYDPDVFRVTVRPSTTRPKSPIATPRRRTSTSITWATRPSPKEARLPAAIPV